MVHKKEEGIYHHIEKTKEGKGLDPSAPGEACLFS